MIYEFPAKLYCKQHNKREKILGIVVALFLVTMIIEVIYNSLYFVTLIFPISYFVFTIIKMKKEKKSFAFVKCLFSVLDDKLIIKFSNPNMKDITYKILYKNLIDYKIYNTGQVEIIYLKGKKESLITFYSTIEDISPIFNEISKNPNNRNIF